MNFCKLCLTMLFAFLTTIVIGQEGSKAALITVDREIKDAAHKRSETRKTCNILKNSNLLSSGKSFWQLNNGLFSAGDRGVEFNSLQPQFSQLWQKVALALPPGAKVKIEAEVCVSVADGIGKNKRPQLALHFYDETGKKRLYAAKEQGRALFLEATGKEFKPFAIDYTVPQDSKSFEAAIKSSVPCNIKVQSVRVMASVTEDELKRLGLQSEPVIKEVVGKFSGQSAKERAMKWFKPGEIYPVMFPVTINMDGKTDDWDKVSLSGQCSYVIPRFQPVAGRSDANITFKIAADLNFLYLLAQVTDDKLMFGKNKNYNDDSLELFLSPTFNQKKENSSTDFHITVTPESAAMHKFYLTGSDNYKGKLNPVIKPVKVSGGWGVEMAIPLQNELVEIKPYDWYCMGFNIAYNDNDTGKRDHKLSWAKDAMEEAWKNPSVLGAIVFMTDNKIPVTVPVAVPSKQERLSDDIKVADNGQPGHFNILRNGSFESGDAGWMQWYGNEGSSYLVVNGNAAEGNKSLCVDGMKLNRDMFSFRLSTHPFNVISGEKYLLRFKAKTDAKWPVGLTVQTKDPFYVLHSIGGVKLNPSADWESKEIIFSIPDIPKHEQNIMQLLISGKSGGCRVWVDDFQLFRYVPAKLDADLFFDRSSYAFPGNEPIAAELLLQNKGTEKVKLKVQSQVKDMYFYRVVSNSIIEKELSPAESARIQLPIEIKQNGFYRLRTTIIDSDTGKIIVRETEFAVYERPAGGAAIAGACINHQIYLQHSAADITQSMIDIGIDSIRMFVERTQEYADGKYDFSSMDILVRECNKRNISVVGCVKVFDWMNRNPVDSLPEYERYIRAIARYFKGRVKVWEIGNEPNLWMGWPPKPDPYEYDLVLRTAWNAIKSEDPDALVATAGFNCAALSGFIEEFLKTDRGNFYDIFAFHPYEFMKSEAAGEGIQKTVMEVEKYQSEPVIYDTESGVERTNIEQAVEMLVKKIPTYLYWGIERHYEFGVDKMASGHFYSYYCSPGSVYSCYAFINVMYKDARCIGELDVGSDFNGYAFKRDKSNFAIVWKENSGNKDGFKISVEPGAKVFDVFGNDITSSFAEKSGRLRVVLPDGNPIYITQVKFAAGQLKTRAQVKRGTECTRYNRRVLLAPVKLRGSLAPSLAAKTTRVLPFYVKNYSSEIQNVSLSGSGDTAVVIGFEPGTFNLKPGEVIQCNVILKSEAQGCYRVSLDGVSNGEKIAPVPLQVNVSGDISISNYGHSVALQNNSERTIHGKLIVSSNGLNITPYQSEISVLPGTSKTLQLKLSPRGADSSRVGFPLNGCSMADCTFVDSEGKTVKESCVFYLAAAYKAAPGSFERPWFPQWLGDKPVVQLKGNKVAENFSGKILFRYSGDCLYVAAEIDDSIQFQKNDVGFIGDGDAIIVGIDQEHDSSGKGLDNNDFECGFALRNDGRIVKYRWDGKHGLESATTFNESKAAVFHNQGHTYYNIMIPVNVRLERGKSIGVAVKIVNRNMVEGKCSTIDFGGGLNEIRDASAFGSLLLK